MADDDVIAGVHNYSEEENYVRPSEPLIQERLEWFQDQKLALMMHWGPYSQVGLVESWALSDADADWSRTDVDWERDGNVFKEQYFDLAKTFNPVRFMPEQWARFAANCGFKYLIFTTKHHDGFCMWDSAFSSYKTTAPECPFHKNPKADVVRHVFDAFRAEGMGIAAYFSKADWHIPSYWENHTNTSRGPSYDPAEKPALWKTFREYTKNQILELCEKYGKIDILWFDAGWVRAPKQDIDINDIVASARALQPWIISADRTCGGSAENYITPEQCVPPRPLSVPWESCVTAGTSFSYRFDDRYKTADELVRLLVDIVSKGGNLALNIGPQPDGRLSERAMENVLGMGQWLARNGEAIYGTRAVMEGPFADGDVRYTRKGNKIYAIVFCRVGYPLRGTLSFAVNPAWRFDRISLLDGSRRIPFERQSNQKVSMHLPVGLSERIAQVFVLE